MGDARPRKKLNALDRSFLAAERRDAMMHVGALFELSPPPGGNPATLSATLRDELARSMSPGASEPWSVRSPWNLRLTQPDLLASPLQAWEPDRHFDIEYHVRRSALASPGDERELGILVSRLHSQQLDFHRPPWEAHFIEGLEGNRLAIYVKVHHSLLDGETGMRILARSLSRDPDETTPLFFTKESIQVDLDDADRAPTLAMLLDLARDQVSVAKDIGRALVNVVRDRNATDRVLALTAPSSVLNQKITRSRRFATYRIELDRVKKVAHQAGGTLNDVVLALSGYALRRFLMEKDALPEKSLVAMVPVSVRPQDDDGGGNAIGAILASLATDDDDPRIALQTIIASTRRAKAQLSGMSRNAIIQYSALVLAPMLLSFLPGVAGRFRPAFNVVISNLPGPEEHLYFRGWRLDEMYPLSIPFHGYGLNITVQSYARWLNFGFTGCRDTLPHLQRLAVYAGEAMTILEG